MLNPPSPMRPGDLEFAEARTDLQRHAVLRCPKTVLSVVRPADTTAAEPPTPRSRVG
jgi:hypothetical protein